MIQPTAPADTGQWTSQRVVLTTLGALLVGLGFWLVFRFYNVAFIFFAALVLGTAIRPAVDWLYRRKLPRAAGVILVYLVLLALLTGFILLLAPMLVEQTKAIIAELTSRATLSDVISDDSGISFSFTKQSLSEQPALTVWQLMAANLEDVHLLDVDEDHDLATSAELNQDTLTVQGISDWSDVLDATVERINFGDYGLQLHVSGSSPQRLKDFSYMLSGQCPISDYERWVTHDDGETFEMKWSDHT